MHSLGKYLRRDSNNYFVNISIKYIDEMGANMRDILSSLMGNFKDAETKFVIYIHW